MKKRGKGGLSNLAISVIWLLLVSGFLLAAFEATGADSVNGALTIAKNKATQYAECIPTGECGLLSMLKDLGGEGPNFDLESNSGEIIYDDNGETIESHEAPVVEQGETISREIRGYRGPVKGEPYVNEAGLINKEDALDLLANISVKEESEVGYTRSEWKHWSSTDRSCWNTRELILLRDAKPGTVIFIDKQKNNTTDESQACGIGKMVEEDGETKLNTENSGEWIDPYSGRKITSSSDIDIDHIIPLSYAAKNGGQEWASEVKEQFANDPDNLLATSAKENRSKGDKGPGSYMPSYKPYRCQYSKAFTKIANKYQLSIQKADYEMLETTLKECQI